MTAAIVGTLPSDGATISGTMRITVQGTNIQNLELLPASGYSPLYERGTIFGDHTGGYIDFDTTLLKDGSVTVRVSAFDAPPGGGGTDLIVMAPRTWVIKNTTAAPPPPAAPSNTLVGRFQVVGSFCGWGYTNTCSPTGSTTISLQGGGIFRQDEAYTSEARYSYGTYANLYQGADGTFYIEVDGFAQRKAVKVLKIG